MKYVHRPARNSAVEPPSTPVSPPEALPDSISESMQRNLSLLRVACESFVPVTADAEAGDTDAPVDDDRGRVWLYLPALRSDGESDEIRLLASALADQFGLVASVIVETSSVTVIVERRGNA